MNYKLYSQEFWKTIEEKTFNALDSNSKPIAVFDADGTLWDADLGENLFHYIIDQKLVPLPKDPWNHYLDLKKQHGDPRVAYAWLAQILDQVPLETVRSWSNEALKSIQPVPLFPEQLKLIELFLLHEVQIFIVTASVKWAVEPGAKLFKISENNVIGIETEVIDGIISKNIIHPITYLEGKAEALLKRTGGQRPFFASGNTIGDLQLLECATDIRLAVSAASRDDRIFKTEDQLAKIASDRGWFYHRFINS